MWKSRVKKEERRGTVIGGRERRGKGIERKGDGRG